MSSRHSLAKKPLADESIDRFVPRRFLELLRVDHVSQLCLGSNTERELTVLFSDIRDFTAISETMTPPENLAFINSYLSTMEPVIDSHGGVIDKFIGDAIMALFPGRADDAVACAVDMLHQLETYNAGRARAGYQAIRIGIGLNTGLVMLGTVGGEHRMDTTVIGDAVNLASRLESLTKSYRSPLVIGEETLYRLERPAEFDVRYLDRVFVKGKQQAQSVYEVFSGDPEPLKRAKRATLAKYEQALAFFHLERLERALPLLEECVARVPDDLAAGSYLARARRALASGSVASTNELSVEFSWQPQFEVGWATIDEEHRELVARIAELARAVRQGKTSQMNDLLEFVGKYAQTHFHSEERLMSRSDYPFTREHVWQHKRFVEFFLKLAAEIRSGNHDPLYLAFRIQLHLVDWFVTHSTGVDRHLVRHLRAVGLSDAR